VIGQVHREVGATPLAPDRDAGGEVRQAGTGVATAHQARVARRRDVPDLDRVRRVEAGTLGQVGVAVELHAVDVLGRVGAAHLADVDARAVAHAGRDVLDALVEAARGGHVVDMDAGSPVQGGSEGVGAAADRGGPDLLDRFRGGVLIERDRRALVACVPDREAGRREAAERYDGVVPLRSVDRVEKLVDLGGAWDPLREVTQPAVDGGELGRVLRVRPQIPDLQPGPIGGEEEPVLDVDAGDLGELAVGELIAVVVGGVGEDTDGLELAPERLRHRVGLGARCRALRAALGHHPDRRQQRCRQDEGQQDQGGRSRGGVLSHHDSPTETSLRSSSPPISSGAQGWIDVATSGPAGPIEIRLYGVLA